MRLMKKTKHYKGIFILCVMMGLMLSGFAVNNVTAATGDIASSTVTRYPVTYGSATGTAIYNEIGQYSLRLIGNSNTLGYDRGRAQSHPYYEYIDVDDDTTTYNSSSMNYVSQGSVKKAFLYIAQSYEVTGLQNATRDNAFILGPSGSKFYFDEGYQDAYYDITEFVQQEGNGTYWGKNIDSERVQNVNRDNFANWEILIVEESPDFTYRNIVVNGFHLRMQNATNTLNTTLSSIPMASSNITGQVILSSAGGNASLFSGSAYVNSMQNGVQIGQTPLPSGVRGSDLLQGRITTNGVDDLNRNPTDTPANIDLLTQDLDVGSIENGADNIGFRLTTATDIVFLHMFGVAVDIGIPDIGMKTYFSTQGEIESSFKLNDEVEINNIISSNPTETSFYLDSPVAKIQLPVGTRYIPNSTISVDNPITNEIFNPTTGELRLYFTNTITTDSFNFSYKIKSEDGIRISDITTVLNGINKVQTEVTDLELAYNSNSVRLFPSYPIIVNHINEKTGNALLQETLIGEFDESFSADISTFEGLSFNPDANNSPLDGTFTDSSQIINLYYLPNIYRLSFNVNQGNSVTPADEDVEFEALASKPEDPTRVGYTFKGWNTSENGSGDVWDFASTTMPAKDVILYAQWEKNVDPAVEYTLRFNLNGGQGTTPTNQILREGQKAKRPINPTREGYVFKEWNTSKDGKGSVWDFDSNTMPAKDVELYAQWQKNEIPKTGDSSNAILISILFILAGIALMGIGKKRFLK